MGQDELSGSWLNQKNVSQQQMLWALRIILTRKRIILTEKNSVQSSDNH